MVATIGAVASASQGVSYYERDGYYANDDPAHKEASAWAGRGAGALGLSGQVDPGVFKAVLEGRVPDGSGRRLGRRVKDGAITHRPGRDLTLSAPKSVSLAALVGGDERIVSAHDKAVKRTLGWVEKHVAETRLRDEKTGRMVRAGGQEMVAATFRHGTSRTSTVLSSFLRLSTHDYDFMQEINKLRAHDFFPRACIHFTNTLQCSGHGLQSLAV